MKFNELPSKSSFAKDYWGYYNGINNNSSFLPDPKHLPEVFTTSLKGKFPDVFEFNSYSDWRASLEYMGKGMLDKIIYPTGGWTIYEFEPHQYEKYYYEYKELPKKNISALNEEEIEFEII